MRNSGLIAVVVPWESLSLKAICRGVTRPPCRCRGSNLILSAKGTSRFVITVVGGLERDEEVQSLSAMERCKGLAHGAAIGQTGRGFRRTT